MSQQPTEIEGNKIEGSQSSQQNQSSTYSVDFVEIKKLKSSSKDEVKKESKLWALEQGFELVQLSSKDYGLYFECKFSGKPRVYKGLEKTRNKVSKKIGKLLT